MIRSAPVSLLAVMTLVFALSCGDKDKPTPRQPGSTSGTLTVAVTPPTGGTAAVTVTGPDGYSKDITATETIAGLSPGSYTVSGTRVIVAGAVVSTVYDASVTGSPATVAVAATATAQVTYSQRAGSGKLWITDKNANTVYALTPDQITASGTPVPDIGLGFPGGSQVYSGVFDASGNLWLGLVTGTPRRIVKLAPPLLAASSAPTETASIADVNGPTRLAFDGAGNLWVADSFNSTLVKYKASDLGGTGVLAISPVVTIDYSGFITLNGLAFDSVGNLWVASTDIVGPYYSTILKYTPAQLAATGNVSTTPSATISHLSLSGIQGLAFDKHGNLWVTCFGTDGSDPSIKRYDASQLGATTGGTVAPAYTITNAGLASPAGMAFDEGGNLWVAHIGGFKSVARFAASQLVATGTATVVPGIVISGGSSMGWNTIAFNPAAAGLQLPR